MDYLPPLFIYIFAFLFGITVGSFLNVCIYRLPRDESIIFPPSHCPFCNMRLKFVDLLPILSFIIQKGKCRYCNNKISIVYPIVELLSGLNFIVNIYYFKLSIAAAIFIVFCSLLIIIFFIDLFHYIIPFKVTLPGILFGLIISFKNPFLTKFWHAFLAAFIGFVLFYLLQITTYYIYSKKIETIGGGDIILASMMGAFLGKYLFIALFLAFLIGGVVGILLILLKIKTLKSHIPFGPALAAGSVLTIFIGEKLYQFYQTLYFYY